MQFTLIKFLQKQYKAFKDRKMIFEDKSSKCIEIIHDTPYVNFKKIEKELNISQKFDSLILVDNLSLSFFE